MKKTIIDRFVETCKANTDKTAFIGNGRKISFGALLGDMYRMVQLIKDSGLKPGDQALIFVLPSYEFFLLMFAGIYCGINLVVTDNYKDINAVRNILKSNRIPRVFCNSLTGCLRPAFPGITFINVATYRAFPDTVQPCDCRADATVLTTFTSGTTGQPTPIYRNVQDFQEQIRIISENICLNPQDVVFSKLPIYSLFLIFNGYTCVVSHKIRRKQLEKHGVCAILAPIANLLAIEEELPFVQKVFIGGAMLYPGQVSQILSRFPNADVTYIYGASECVLMAKANLREFHRTLALQTDISSVSLSIVNKDENGVGQVCTRGRVVLTDTKEHISNDLGYMDESGLHLVGRKAFSTVGRYNYMTDIALLAENPGVRKGFSMAYENKIYFCYEGRICHKKDDVVYVRFRKLPMDAKHRTKLNYHKALTVIKRKYGV